MPPVARVGTAVSEANEDQDAPSRRSDRVRVGIISWSFPEWRGLVYPKKSKPEEFLRHYAERFPIVEAASSFYGLPGKSTFATWASATPKGFEISLKVPDRILRQTGKELDAAIEKLMDNVEPLARAKKLGTLVAQFGPTYKRAKKADELAAFVRALPKSPRWAIELRDPSWWHDDTYDTLRRAKVTLVWSAWDGKQRTPAVATTDRLYLRIFGDRKLKPPYAKKRRDRRAELEHWADAIRGAGPKVKRADVMVSKFLEGYAPASAATMNELLA